MLLGLILGVVVIAMVAYGFWMAGELGVAPSWRRPRVPSVSRFDAASEGIAREHDGR